MGGVEGSSVLRGAWRGLEVWVGGAGDGGGACGLGVVGRGEDEGDGGGLLVVPSDGVWCRRGGDAGGHDRKVAGVLGFACELRNLRPRLQCRALKAGGESGGTVERGRAASRAGRTDARAQSRSQRAGNATSMRTHPITSSFDIRSQSYSVSTRSSRSSSLTLKTKSSCHSGL